MEEAIRKRVKIPGVDSADTLDFYSEGPKGHEPLNKTALREAERKYKSRKDLDLSKVVDFSSSSCLSCTKEALKLSFEAFGKQLTCTGFSLEGKEGFLYFPSAIPMELQQRFVKDIMKEYIVAGNESNLHPFYIVPDKGLFESGRQVVYSRSIEKPSASGVSLLKKLR
jgi:hypothetical protein